tara:strand:+ start:1475 stop:1933 length:459 start_codon:yes stop_codon:yes gene_type:complete
MTRNDITTSSLNEKFTVEKTKLFQRDLDIALKTMELIDVMKVFIKYEILRNKETKEFLDAFIEMNESWQRKYEGSVIVGEIQTSMSRCIACQFGKGMTVYEFQYKHSEAPFPNNQIVYMSEFGMLYDIKDGILHNISICNAFLNKQEMNALI